MTGDLFSYGIAIGLIGGWAIFVVLRPGAALHVIASVIVDMRVVRPRLSSFAWTCFCLFFSPGLVLVAIFDLLYGARRGTLAHLVTLMTDGLPHRVSTADHLLIFVKKPDTAEAILGDLLEETRKVRARKSAFVTWVWFWWEILWIVLHQGGERVRENTILGRLADALVKRIGG